jgi:hypothetical protein
MTGPTIGSNFLADPKVWISVLALLVSCFSVFLSWRSGRNAARALAISENQEKRRQPQLGLYLFNGYRLLTPNRQLFGLLVSVSNPSDINNSVARVELQITYLLENDVAAVCRLPHDPTLRENTSQDTQAATVFSVPVRIEAHQTVTGWFLFALNDDVIGKGSVDGHQLILEDTHHISTSSGPIMVKEWMNERAKGSDRGSPST